MAKGMGMAMGLAWTKSQVIFSAILLQLYQGLFTRALSLSGSVHHPAIFLGPKIMVIFQSVLPRLYMAGSDLWVRKSSPLAWPCPATRLPQAERGRFEGQIQGHRPGARGPCLHPDGVEQRRQPPLPLPLHRGTGPGTSPGQPGLRRRCRGDGRFGAGNGSSGGGEEGDGEENAR